MTFTCFQSSLPVEAESLGAAGFVIICLVSSPRGLWPTGALTFSRIFINSASSCFCFLNGLILDISRETGNCTESETVERRETATGTTSHVTPSITSTVLQLRMLKCYIPQCPPWLESSLSLNRIVLGKKRTHSCLYSWCHLWQQGDFEPWIKQEGRVMREHDKHWISGHLDFPEYGVFLDISIALQEDATRGCGCGSVAGQELSMCGP